MKYPKSIGYDKELVKEKIMGPNPLKLIEEILEDSFLQVGSVVMDLGCGSGITSVFLAKEYGYKVFATDLWSNPSDNYKFYKEMGLSRDQIVPIHADANELPYAEEFFDGVISIDSYNYYGLGEDFLDKKLMPYIKKGGYLYISMPGMKKDFKGKYPDPLLLSWGPAELDTLKDMGYWKKIISKSKLAEVVSIKEMAINDEAWADWLETDNPYAISDRPSINAGGCKYLNFIAIVLRRKQDIEN